MQLDIRELPAMRLAYLRHTGPYGDPAIGLLWQRFATWCAAQGFMQPRRETYGIAQDDPATTPPGQRRYDSCIAVDAGFRAQGDIQVQDFAAGRFACLPFQGTPEQMPAAWMALYGRWVPENGLQHQARAGVEIYPIDYSVDPVTGAFNCFLCAPVA